MKYFKLSVVLRDRFYILNGQVAGGLECAFPPIPGFYSLTQAVALNFADEFLWCYMMQLISFSFSFPVPHCYF